MNALKQHGKLALITVACTLASCGGGGTDIIQEEINGPGGVWFGSFVEQEKKTNNDDIDIGGIYLDIPTDITGSVKGAMSYQVYDCQNRNDLTIEGQKTRKNLQVTVAKGDVDPRASANDAIDSASKAVILEIKGSYLQDASNTPWGGSYDVISTDGDDKTRISPECNNQTYSFADNGVWRVFPQDTKFGITANYDKASNVLTWTNLKDAKQTLIMQLDTTNISSSNSAFIKQEMQVSNLTTYNPTVRSGKESTMVIQVFSDAGLIGFDAITITQ